MFSALPQKPDSIEDDPHFRVWPTADVATKRAFWCSMSQFYETDHESADRARQSVVDRKPITISGTVYDKVGFSTGVWRACSGAHREALQGARSALSRVRVKLPSLSARSGTRDHGATLRSEISDLVAAMASGGVP
jgi:hypothetical protein